MYAKKDMISGLEELGLAEGDVVLTRVALRSVGSTEGKTGLLLIEAIIDVVGMGGGIIGLSHTRSYPFSKRFSKRCKEQAFRPDIPCTSGGFAAAMLDWENSYRSRHPTNSMVAIGAKALEIISEHDENSTCFDPIHKLIEVDGKMILIGCGESSPGFSTVHLVYEKLNLASKSLLSGFYGSYYEKDGKLRWFRKKDVPGCSKGFGNFYPYYEKKGVLRLGNMGDAGSMLIRARDAYKVELELIKRNPKISLCDNPQCRSCRGTKLFNVSDMPRYYMSRVLKKGKR